MDSYKGKYSKYIQTIKRIANEFPDMGTDTIAQKVAVEFPEDEISLGSLSRQIRKFKWHEDARGGFKYAKILVADIETLPYHVSMTTWNPYETRIKHTDIKKPLSMVTWAAKWLFEDKIISAKCTPEEAMAHDDKRIAQAFWNLLDEADVVIFHNGRKYDIKVAQARWFANGMKLPSDYQNIDTLAAARKMFGNKLGSNRLDHLASFVLGVDGKMETPKGLWERCDAGDQEAIDFMDKYCQQDIFVLEDVYLAMRPYIKPHPNIPLIENSHEHCCPTCGSSDITDTGQVYRTYVNQFDTFRCGECGTVSRARKNSTPLPVKQVLNVSMPR